MSPISIVVADDHEVVRTGFAAMLGTQPDFVVLGTASDGASAVQACRSLQPDLIIMDIRMPGVDGIEATRQLSSSDHPPKVLILTTFGLDKYVFDALRAGASGFLLKDVTAEQLYEGVRVVAAADQGVRPAWVTAPAGRWPRRRRCAGPRRADPARNRSTPSRRPGPVQHRDRCPASSSPRTR